MQKIGKKIFHTGLFFIVLGLVAMFSVSYSYFSKTVVANDVNLEVGVLEYTLNSDFFSNNHDITVPASKSIKIEMIVKSDVEIDSKYQVYYKSDNDLTDVVIAYLTSSVDITSGNIDAGGEKKITLGLQNNSSSDVVVTLGVRGGLVNNTVADIILKDGEVRLDQSIDELYDTSGCPILVEAEPNKPELTSGMIAVTYNTTSNSWVKADTTKTDWYDYENQIWANAVTVTESTGDIYLNLAVGEAICMSDINTMWVWIPRYSYTIRDTYGVQLSGGNTPSKATPGAIDIKFIAKGEKDAGTGKCTKCPDSWVTPVAFTFGTEEISGFWMAKFGISGSIGTACTNENCTTADISVIPNEVTLTNKSISNFFFAFRSMQNSTNAIKYGFDVIGSGSMVVHMLKSSEWGAVANLSQSKYGKYGNPSYTGTNKEIYQNKSSTRVTGMSNGIPSSSTTNTQVTYDTPNTGYGASTTGTIYGVYDMSGGPWEYTMSNYNKYAGYKSTATSGFSGSNINDGTTSNGLAWPSSEFYDLYTSETASTGYKFGDATYETNNWYGDNASFAGSKGPWFVRGGDNTDATIDGIFLYYHGYGNPYNAGSARVVIKP